MSANKGEWSELLALATILDAGQIELGSAQKKIGPKIGNKPFDVLGAMLPAEPATAVSSFEIEGEFVKLFRGGRSVGHVSRREIARHIPELYRDIQNGSPNGSRTFDSTAGQEIKTLLQLQTLGSKVQNFDLLLDVKVDELTKPKRLGFSIKSEIGGAWTLLNASGLTNFEYELDHPELSPEALVLPHDEKSVNKNVQSLIQSGWRFGFVDIQSSGRSGSTFQENLRDIDPRFPALLAMAVLGFYGTQKNKFLDIVDDVAKGEDDPEMVIDLFHEFMIRKLQGLVAGTPYREPGIPLGGILYVRSNGTVETSPILDTHSIAYDLMSQLKFERPDRRNKFGSLIRRRGKTYFKLNLQLRKG
jgi:hypothetical protein